jgi:hypothetical protein
MTQLTRANSEKKDKDDINLAKIESELEDEDSTPASYSVFAYPTDFTLEVLVDKWTKGDIIIPTFQRRFVWTPTQCSRLIESFLHGLPVPPIFLFFDPDNKLLVVDGQQRLRTIAYFFAGDYGRDESGNKKEFRLTGLNKKSAFLNKSYSELESSNLAAYNKLNNSVLRAFIIKQDDPKDDSSIYHVFERLNTGGTIARGQEIRNCIYHGKFNDLLRKLNKPDEGVRVSKEFAETVTKWRAIIGKRNPDRRFRDVELILRFFALYFAPTKYKPPMKEFLNRYMKGKRKITRDDLQQHQDVFQKTVNAVFDALGSKPFHIEAGLNIAVFDSVFIAFAQNLDKKIPDSIETRYRRLIADPEFKKNVTAATTNIEVVADRLKLAKKTLFGNTK